MRRDDLRPIALFDGLDDAQLDELLAAGEDVAIVDGVELFREGEHADFWWVLVDGAIELVRHVGREDVVVGRMAKAGLWAGGFRARDEQGVYLATARGVEPGRMFRLPSASLRALLDEWFPFGVHIVNGIFGTARRIEATARQRDSPGDPGPARGRTRARAEQPRRRGRARRVRPRDGQHLAVDVAGRARPAADLGRAVRQPRRAATRAGRAAAIPRRTAASRRRGTPRRLAGEPRCRARVGDRARPGRRGGRHRVVRAHRRPARTRRVGRARLGGRDDLAVHHAG
ncbi:cyclic nucleotide-binding domain-containing protein [Nocardioides sp. B-3]|uniref:cyclic nucleotide-binding domain-containing protein n=1 Tax=Nocardioides sp. B-3 TaxID=2895565 RepID=UPI0021526CA4|nr:cyclic nucleotide-binding domain-containing protein [Nocardioides sp. B-3]UUZ59268.1 cyclic nucleotide-binding domain-containing protein [Nocardioides sp. B-3]